MLDVKRCEAFWAREPTDRPLLSSLVGAYSMVRNYPHGVSRLPDGDLAPEDIEVEAFAPDYEKLFAKSLETGVDVPWAAYPLVSVPWVEAIAGCPIHNSGGNMVARPWVEDYGQLRELKIEPSNRWLAKLLEFSSFLVKLSDGRFPVSNSLMRGPLDLLAAARGSERMCLDLYDRPGEIDGALERLTDIWIQVAREQASRIPSFQGGYSFGQIDLWGRKQGGWFQNDALALWSPELHLTHARACEERLSRSMDATGMHLHPHSLFAVEELVRMSGLGVIEVNYEKPYGMPLAQMMPHLRRAIESKRLSLWGEFDEVELQLLKDGLPTSGLSLQLIGETPEIVRATVQSVEKIWGS